MKLSSRTFGVEFELFFTKQNLTKLLTDNKTIICEQDTEDLKQEYSEYKKRSKKPISFPKFRERDYTSCIREIVNDSYEVYDCIYDILEEKLGLQNWDVKEDCSIHGGNLTMEIVTPILKGEKGLSDITKFLKYFSQFASVNDTCGLHVHVGAGDFISAKNSNELYAAAILQYYTFENIFDSMVTRKRRENNNSYTQAVAKPDIVLSSFLEGDEDIQDDRYYKLNLQALHDHGTLEFRQMHGVLDYRVVTNWVKLCTSFVDKIKNECDEWKPFLNNKKLTSKTREEDIALDSIRGKLKVMLESNKYSTNHKDAIDKMINTMKYERRSRRVHFEYGGYTIRRGNILKEIVAELYRDRKGSYSLGQNVYRSYDSWYTFLHNKNSIIDERSLINFEEAELELIPIKKKVATKAGYPKGINTRQIKLIQKRNRELFGKQMAA